MLEQSGKIIPESGPRVLVKARPLNRVKKPAASVAFGTRTDPFTVFTIVNREPSGAEIKIEALSVSESLIWRKRIRYDYPLSRITFAGTPAATVYGGMSRVTTLPAPMTAPSPIVTPFRTTTSAPSQQSRPIQTGA